MRRVFCAWIVTALAVVIAQGAASAEQDGAQSSGVVVAVVEPRTAGQESDRLDYSVSLGESKFETVTSILAGLAHAGGKHLAILIREDVPIGTASSIVSMASKAGYVDYTILIFDREQKGMVVIPSFHWIGYSTDPLIVGKFFH